VLGVFGCVGLINQYTEPVFINSRLIGYYD